LIQLKTSLARDCKCDLLLKRRSLVTTTDTVTLAALTALFAVFAATMAWAEMLTRRHIAAHVPVLTSSQRKRPPF
jgi:hypothetical protein